MSSHIDILDRAIVKLRALDLGAIAPNMIYHSEFPFDRQPAPGLAVGVLTEMEGPGAVGHDDYSYGLVLVRVFGGQHGKDPQGRSDWRFAIREGFHRRLMGSIDNEIITKVRPASIKRSKQWRDWGIDTSVMEIWTWVRENRGS